MSMFPPQPVSMIWLGSPCHAFTTLFALFAAFVHAEVAHSQELRLHMVANEGTEGQGGNPGPLGDGRAGAGR